MPFERVVVSSEEIKLVQPLPGTDAPPPTMTTLPSPVPWWARVGLLLLVPVLPLLCVVAVILRVAFRSESGRVKYAWVSFVSTLLVISGFLTTMGTVLFFSFVPVPAMVNTGLPDLDERGQYPSLPSASDFSGADVSAKLKPLVVVISPASKLWGRQEAPSAAFGAGVLLHADKDGYLFATANHVVNYSGWGSNPGSGRVLLSTESGVWSKADVIANAPELDMALLWVGRNSGSAEFVQPVSTASDGESIFVIGHPEGLKYTLSTGVVSGMRDQSIQISAAVSPGNSGGPIYDNRGNLIGIVSSKFDSNRDANAENLGFAAKADALLQESDWTFRGNGRQWLSRYIEAVKKREIPVPDPKQNPKSQGDSQD
jgi:S1-C subfamily serine protease